MHPIRKPDPVLLALVVLQCGAFLLAREARAQIPFPRLGGYIQLRETAAEGIGLSAALNRARFSADGSLPSRFSYRLLVETEASAGIRNPATVSLREAIVRWAPGSFALTAGQFKTPFSREYLLPVPVLETPDFAAVVDSLSPKYDVGVMGEYALGPVASVFLGVFNGEGQNAIANRDSTVLPIARLVVRPIAQIGLASSIARDSGDSLRWTAEAQIEERGVMVRGEYITRHVRGRPSEDDDAGWYVLAVVRVVPQVQVLGRQEDFQRPHYGVGRRVHATTVGTIIEIEPNRVRLLLDGVRRRFGVQDPIDTLIGQIQVRF